SSLPSLLLYASCVDAISTLSLHDALPISHAGAVDVVSDFAEQARGKREAGSNLLVRVVHFIESRFARSEVSPCRLRRVFPEDSLDRKSTRLNSSHVKISYAVFCLKKKNRA